MSLALAGLVIIALGLVAALVRFLLWQLPYRLMAGRWPRPRLYTQGEIENLTGKKMTDEEVRELERKREARKEEGRAWWVHRR
jgi:hypothetical protein